MCLKIKFAFQEWNVEIREDFIESLAQMTTDYLKARQDNERKQYMEREGSCMAGLDGQTFR